MINILSNTLGVNQPSQGGSSVITPEEITAIANFHVIGDDAIVDGSNVLVSWQERVGAANMGIQGSNIATIPNHTDGHRAVALNGTNQGFFVPVRNFRSFYLVQKFFRHASEGSWRIFQTSLSNTSSTDVDFWRVVFNTTVNQNQIGRNGISGGRSFFFSTDEMAATTSEGIMVIQGYQNLGETGLIVNGENPGGGGFGHIQTVGDSTYTQIGFKSEGDNQGAFSFWKTEVLEMIGFGTEATTEQHNLVLQYLNQRYPSI